MTGNYKRYIVNITQSGTSDPVVTELFNSYGVTFTWARTGVGVYVITASGDAFEGPGITPAKNGLIAPDNDTAIWVSEANSPVTVEVRSRVSINGALADSLFQADTMIEIITYLE